jgi:outer membrane protein assembly factor BamB
MDHRVHFSSPLVDRRQLIVTVMGAVVGLGFGNGAAAQNPSPVASPAAVVPGEWALPGANLAGTRAAISRIESSNVATLAPAWATDIGGTVVGTPVVAGGSVFVVTWDGMVVALDLASGEQLWSNDLGASVADPMFGGTIGAADGAAVDSGVVYASDAAGTLHAIDAADGSTRWATKVDQQADGGMLAAPAVWNGLVYAPVTSMSEDAPFRGSLVAVSASDGSIAWQRFFALETGTGGNAASIPAIDAESGQLFLTVGGSNSAPPSMFALDAVTGDVRWQTPIEQPADAGLPAPTSAANCFAITVDGVERAVVGAGFPDGVYRVFDRADGSPIWERTVSYGGPFGGILGAAAVGGGRVVVPATNWRTIDAPANGVVMSADAASGKFGWMSITANPAISPVSIANDVALSSGLDGIVRADALVDGAHLWSSQLDSSIGSGIAVLDRTIIFGTGAPAVGSFVKLGTSVVAYALANEGTPIPSAAGEPDASPTVAIADTPTPAGAVFEASMESLKFIPAEIVISVGTTVIWTNDDVVAHTVTQRAKPEDQLFSSPLLAPGESFSFTFDTLGTYAYFCMPHPFMTGTVVVS